MAGDQDAQDRDKSAAYWKYETPHSITPPISPFSLVVSNLSPYVYMNIQLSFIANGALK